MGSRGPLRLRRPRKQLGDCRLSRMYAAHRRLNVIVSGDILQRKGVGGWWVILNESSPLPGPCTLRPQSEKCDAGVQAGIGISLDLFPYLTCLFFQHPRLERLCPILGAREAMGFSLIPPWYRFRRSGQSLLSGSAPPPVLVLGLLQHRHDLFDRKYLPLHLAKSSFFGFCRRHAHVCHVQKRNERSIDILDNKPIYGR
jgi:hypothetical protein